MQELTPLANVVIAHNGVASTTSTKVAEVFGKKHCDVLRSIANLEMPDSFSQRNFASVEYVDAQGKTRPMYNMTRDGFVLLAMGFTGKRALAFKIAYIEAFNAMEQKLRERNQDARQLAMTICGNLEKAFNEVLDARMQERPVMCNGLIPPTVEDVRNYCRSHNLRFVSPEKFVSYYTARNWTQGTKAKPVCNWGKVVEQWNTRASMRHALNA
jgi:Rha family phage regulatory protein